MSNWNRNRAATWLRQHLLVAITLVAVAVVGGLAFAFVAVSHEMSRPFTPAEAAFAACKTTREANQFGVAPTTDVKQSDVGRPHGIVVVPRCSVNVGVSERDPSYFDKDLDVYILVSQEQLKRLDVAIGEAPKANFPYGISDDALDGLMTGRQRAMVETDLAHVSTSYYVIAAPLPTDTLMTDHGYEHTVAPFDMLTGVRYAHLPFTQQDVYNQGPAIIIGGK